MKLYECTYGKLVVEDGYNVGHIVGLGYNLSPKAMQGLMVSNDELLSRTIPIIKFADGTERGIHPANIEEFKG